MRTIGLIGGLTWYSTIEYYRAINREVNERLGGDEAAKIIIHSVNYGEIRTLTEAGDWKGIAAIICDTAKKTEAAGAECLLLGANTMHKIAGEVMDTIRIPLIHIADVVGKAIRGKNIRKVALLGTRYTMLLDFYKTKLAAMDITTIIPGTKEIDTINRGIYEELAKGECRASTKKEYLGIIEGLINQGAEGVILGCTEIPMLIKQEDCSIPVFDTTLLHARAAVDFALG